MQFLVSTTTKLALMILFVFMLNTNVQAQNSSPHGLRCSSVFSQALANENLIAHKRAAHQQNRLEVLSEREAAILLRNQSLKEDKSLLAKLRESALRMWDYAISYRRYQTAFTSYRAEEEFYRLALTHNIIKAGIEFEQFRNSIEKDPLKQFVPRIQALEKLGVRFRFQNELIELLKSRIALIEPWGTLEPQEVSVENRRTLSRLEDLKQTMPVVERIDVMGNKAQFYKQEWIVQIFGQVFTIPEFLPLKEDQKTQMLWGQDDVVTKLIEKAMKIAQSPQWSGRVALLFGDLNKMGLTNYFKNGYNDGDRYIINASKIFKIETRSEDILIRLGGDEFVVFLFDVDPEKARVIAQRISDHVFYDQETNAVFNDERAVLSDLAERIQLTHSRQELKAIVSEHFGLNETVSAAEATANPNTSNIIHTENLRSVALQYLNSSLKKIHNLRAGVSIGISMIDANTSYKEAKDLADNRSRMLKRIYTLQRLPPGAEQEKYPPFTEAESKLYPYDPNARPIVISPTN